MTAVVVNRSVVEQTGQFKVSGPYKAPGSAVSKKSWIVIALALVEGRARYLCVEGDQDVSNPFLAYAGRFSLVEGQTVCEPLSSPIAFDTSGWYFFPRRSDQYRQVEYVPEEAHYEAVYGHGAIPLTEILTDKVEVTRISAQ
jgi:hypothetical protein